MENRYNDRQAIEAAKQSKFVMQWPSFYAFEQDCRFYEDEEHGGIKVLLQDHSQAAGGRRTVDFKDLWKVLRVVCIEIVGFDVKNPGNLHFFRDLRELIVNDSDLGFEIFALQLNQVEVLRLSGSQLPQQMRLGLAPNLKSLRLNLRDVLDPVQISGGEALRELRIEECQIPGLKFLRQCHKLEVLHLKMDAIKSKIEYNLEPVSRLSSLKELILVGLKTSRVTTLNRLWGLERLVINRCNLTEISFIEKMTQLTDLDLSENSITDIDVLSNLRGVTWPMFRKNPINDISRNIFERCYTAKSLVNAGSDWLIRWTRQSKDRIVRAQRYEEAKILRDIEKQLLEGEEILESQYSVLQRNFIRFFIDSNHLIHPPQDVLYEGEEATLNYYRALEEDGEMPSNQTKVIVLGNSTAGKTSLVRYLVHKAYDEKEASTHGIKLEQWPLEGDKDVEGERVPRVVFWDFGGQEYYHATHSLFFSDQAAYLVVYEQGTNWQGSSVLPVHLYEGGVLVKKEVELEHYDYRYWLENVRYLVGTEGQVLVLVETKSDRHPAVAVAPEVMAQYGLDAESQVFRLSTQGAYQGDAVQKLRFDLFRETLKGHVEGLMRQFANSRKWQEIKERLEAEWQDEKVLPYGEWVRRCQVIKPTIHDREGEGRETQLETLTRQLHLQGVLLHYAGIAALRKKVFVNPRWLTDCIYQVLDYDVIRMGGRFDREHLEQRAAATGLVTAKELLALLLEFGLVFEIMQDGVCYYVAPQYLPKEFSREVQRTVRAFEQANRLEHCFTVVYTHFLPVSVFMRVLSSYGRAHLDYWYHRDALVFVCGDKVVKAVQDRNASRRAITIHVQEGDRGTAREMYRELAKGFDRLDVELSADGEGYAPLKDVTMGDVEEAVRRKYWFAWGEELDGPEPVRRAKVLLAFAGGDLGVAQEAEAIMGSVNKAPRVDACLLSNAEVEGLADAVQTHRKDLVMFHFGGHATQKMVQLKDGVEYDKVRLGRLIGGEGHRVQVVFLNACQTYGHVDILLGRGVRAVVATNLDPKDSVARRFATIFYERFLVDGVSLKEAFLSADASMAVGPGGQVHVVSPGEAEAIARGNAMWGLFVKSDAVAVLDARFTDWVVEG